MTFRVLYVPVIMSHDRRRIVHFNVTTSPSARWTARQVVAAFPYKPAPHFLLHDRDTIFRGSSSVSTRWASRKSSQPRTRRGRIHTVRG